MHKIADITQLQFWLGTHLHDSSLSEKRPLVDLPLLGLYMGAGVRVQVLACVLHGPSHLFSFVNQGFRKAEICAPRPQSWEGKGTSSSFKENVLQTVPLFQVLISSYSQFSLSD